MDSNRVNTKKADFIFLMILVSVFVLQIWKSARGMGGVDEDFYITLGYRLVKGDALIYDEWHITQLIAVFLAPLIHAYIAVTGGMDGIVRFFRIAYAVFTAITGTAIYYRFRSAYGLAAAAAAAVFMLVTPFNIMALSYNTMSIGFLALSLMVWKKETSVRILLSGLLFACAVLNTPYLVLLYLPFTIFMFRKKETYGVRPWALFTAGAGIVAVSFLIFLFARETPSQMMEGLRHVVDKGHSDSVLWLLVKGGGKLFQAFGVFFVLFVLEVIAAVVFRNKDEHFKQTYIALSIAVNLVSAVYIVFINPYLPDLGGQLLILFPFALTGLVLILMGYGKTAQFEQTCYFVSLFHALMVAISSNVGPRSFCAMTVTACAMTVLILRKTEMRSIPKLSFCAVFTGLLLFCKITNLYDGPVSFDVRIDRGPFAGLRDTRENAEVYYASLDDIEAINKESGEYAMLVTYKTWEYLALNKKVATNSAFINSGFEEEWVDNQNAYHEMHPDKYPAYVYLDHNDTPYKWTGNEPFFRILKKYRELTNGTVFIFE